MLNDSKANKLFMLAVLLGIALLFAVRSGGGAKIAEKTFAVREGDTLEIITTATDISFDIDDKATEGNVSIGNPDSNRLRIDRDGSTVTIGVDKETRGWDPFSKQGNARLVVTVPSDTIRKLKVTSVSGDIDLMKDIDLDRLEIASTSGDIDGINLRSSDSISITSVSGDLRCFTIESDGEATVSTASGDIDVNAIGGRSVELKTISADVTTTVQLPEGGQATVSSASGDLTMEFQGLSDYALAAQSISGDIMANSDDEQGTDYEDRAGNGSTKVTVETISGDIILKY